MGISTVFYICLNILKILHEFILSFMEMLFKEGVLA